MAKMNMYSVLDRKLRQYGQVVLSPSLPAVQRELAVAVAGSSSLMEKYPEDFDLYWVGDFDTDTGVVTAGVPELQENLSKILEDHKHGG